MGVPWVRWLRDPFRNMQQSALPAASPVGLTPRRFEVFTNVGQPGHPVTTPGDSREDLTYDGRDACGLSVDH